MITSIIKIHTEYLGIHRIIGRRWVEVMQGKLYRRFIFRIRYWHLLGFARKRWALLGKVNIRAEAKLACLTDICQLWYRIKI